MSSSTQATCHIVRPGDTTYAGKQGFSYFEGIAKQTVGSKGICMHLLTIPLIAAIAIGYFMLGFAFYALGWLVIPAGVPHLPTNLSDKPASAVITRTDPNEQESVVLLPELDALVDFSRTAA